MNEYIIKVGPQHSGTRLDMFIFDFANNKNLGFSRTFIQGLIQDGLVKVNDISAKPHHKVKAEDRIKIIIEKKVARTIEAESTELNVVYEDKDVAIINKPIGLVVHPAPGNYEHTLVNAMLSRFKTLSDINPERPGIVHRLDKETSGLLVITKNNPAHLSLAKQFAEHSIKRRYVALVKGKMEFDENVIDAPIGRHPFKRKNMAVGIGKNLKYAKTRYRTIKRSQKLSLLELEPFTGRTHQLRVHLASIGHPILGDAKYGKNNEFSRMALHATTIGFIHPTSGKFIEFTTEIPPEFKEAIENTT